MVFIPRWERFKNVKPYNIQSIDFSYFLAPTRFVYTVNTDVIELSTNLATTKNGSPLQEDNGILYADTQYHDTPHNNDYLVRPGANDQPYSWAVDVKINDVSGLDRFIAKSSDTLETNLEYFMGNNAGKGILFIYDEINNASNRIRVDTDGVVFEVGKRYIVVFTYDGSELQTGLNIYVNGVKPAQTKLKEGVYTGANNQSFPVQFGAILPNDEFSDFSTHTFYGAQFFQNRELTAEEVVILSDNFYSPLKPRRSFFVLPAAGENIIGLTTETDSAQPLSVLKTHLINQSLETDSALPISSLKSAVIGQAVETDTTQSLTHSKLQTVGQAVETDTSLPVSSGLFVTVGQAVETSTVLVLTHSKTQIIAQAVETDSTQSLSASKTQAVGQVIETDTGLSATHSKTQVIGQAIETDSVLPVTSDTSIGLAIETDTAQGMAHSKAQVVEQVSETDTSLSLTHSKTLTVGQASETATASSVTHSKAQTVGQAAETDTALSLLSVSQAVGQVIETDSARPINWSKAFLINAASEMDTALTLDESTVGFILADVSISPSISTNIRIN